MADIDIKTKTSDKDMQQTASPSVSSIISQEDLSGFGVRRTVLIVEDVWINREMLAGILGQEYDVLTAENGAEGLKLLEENLDNLALVLLDMYMPVCNGFEFLKHRQRDELLSQVPVIVATGSDNPDDEVTCLELGASDFITKPYNAEIVLCRVRSIIRLHESETTISAVKFDDLTTLYTKPAFMHYAEIMLNTFKNKRLDVFIADIINLHRIEAVFGEKKSNEIVGYFGRQFTERAREAIGYRQGSQFVFLLVYDENRHDMDYWLKLAEVIEAGSPVATVQVKYGLYYNVDKSLAIADICERAHLTVDSIVQKTGVNYAVYNEEIARSELDKFRMEADFEDALTNNEFVIFLQPKYDLVREKVVAAEALVRWRRSDGSMVSPGAFIPLFESDGRIVKLDEYIFRKVCGIQRKRMDLGLPVVRISINLSRATLISGNVVDKYAAIVEESGIPYDRISVELTESFALENAQMGTLARELVSRGFRLDMDDFGSGYSSMASLVNLPFQVVKFDKSLIDQIGDARGEIIIRHAIIIAHELKMMVVAEGVETAEQVDFLRSVSCDVIQGFYFGRPIPNEEFYARITD